MDSNRRRFFRFLPAGVAAMAAPVAATAVAGFSENKVVDGFKTGDMITAPEGAIEIVVDGKPRKVMFW
jgi:hypothetical protein